jgi:hypothetical protein
MTAKKKTTSDVRGERIAKQRRVRKTTPKPPVRKEPDDLLIDNPQDAQLPDNPLLNTGPNRSR